MLFCDRFWGGLGALLGPTWRNLGPTCPPTWRQNPTKIVPGGVQMPSQLSSLFRCPFGSIFHRFSDPPNLEKPSKNVVLSLKIKEFSYFQHMTSQMPSKLQNRAKIPPKYTQNAPKRLPRGSQDPPKRLQERSKRLQDASNSPPRSPKCLPGSLPELPDDGQEAPRRLQESPKSPGDAILGSLGVISEAFWSKKHLIFSGCYVASAC